MLTYIKPVYRSLLVAVLALGSIASLNAQQATVTGRIIDQSEAAMPGVTVTAANTETGIKTVVTTDAEGLYTIPLLPPGRYTIAAEIAGFQSQTRSGITLDVQQTVRFDFRLQVGSATETVEVRSPIVET